jgi:glutamine synthetase
MLGIQNLPEVNKDYSYRNRISPADFTGNKFEFRALVIKSGGGGNA